MIYAYETPYVIRNVTCLYKEENESDQSDLTIFKGKSVKRVEMATNDVFKCEDLAGELGKIKK